jgi:hypothetical protein
MVRNSFLPPAPAIDKAVPPKGSAFYIGKTDHFDPTIDWTESTIAPFLSSDASWQARSHALWWVWFNSKFLTWVHKSTPYALKNNCVGKPYEKFNIFCDHFGAKNLTASTGYRYVQMAHSRRYKDLYKLDLEPRYILQLSKLHLPEHDNLFNYFIYSCQLGIKPLTLQPILDHAEVDLAEATQQAKDAFLRQRHLIGRALMTLPRK